jgi:hypothetical protein
MLSRKEMQTFKIGFGYKAQRGKDTACRAIINTFSGLYSVRSYAFADALRDEVNEAAATLMASCGYRSDEAMRALCLEAVVPYDTNALTSPQYPFGKQRALLQWWGTEYRRAQDADYWVKRLAERIEKDAPEFAVISDLRFANEYQFCDYRVRMDRPGFEIDDGKHHISEHVLDNLPNDAWDHIITASCSLEVERKALEFFSTRFHAKGEL